MSKEYAGPLAIHWGLQKGYPLIKNVSAAKGGKGNILKMELRPLTQSSKRWGIWSSKIMIIVDELIRVGYSERQAFILTGQLLQKTYPHVYLDPNPDRVRQRYKAHTKDRAPSSSITPKK